VTVQAIWVSSTHLRENALGSLENLSPEGFTFIHLKLDTHSGDLLKADLVGLATLAWQEGAEIGAVRWISIAENGHHREGLLVFPGQSNDQRASQRGKAILVLKGIASVPERAFIWEF